MIKLKSQLLLASGSPRRKEILKAAGFEFEIVVKDINENYPSDLPTTEVASYLAELKSQSYKKESENYIILTADTVVCLDGIILGKPLNEAHAIEMLNALSGKKHKVISGACIYYQGTKKVLHDKSEVYFKKLATEEINFYVKQYKPFDKAGAYGIQEWIGLIGIEKIYGSYYNVMGLPIHLVYAELLKYQH